MSNLHVQCHCPICYAWVSLGRVQSLPCGHIFCADCVTKLKMRLSCPTCRARFLAEKVHKLFVEVRDKRTRKFKKLLQSQRSSSVVDDDMMEPPSSSRAGSPSLSQIENDDVDSYRDEVHEQAALCANALQELKLGSAPRVVSGMGAEIMKVVNQMNHRPGDNVEVLLEAVAKFLQVAGRVYAELASSRELAASHATRMAGKERLQRELTAQLAEATHDTKVLRRENAELSAKLIRSTELVDEAVTTTERIAAQNRELKKSVDSLQQQVREISAKCKLLENGNRSWAKKTRNLEKQVEELQVGVQLSRTQTPKVVALPRRDHSGSSSPELVIASDDEHFNEESDDDDEVSLRSAVMFDLPSPKDQPAYEAQSSSSRPASNIRPRFGTGWNLSKQSMAKKKLSTNTGFATPSFPIKLDSKGRPIGNVQVGTRAKMNRHS